MKNVEILDCTLRDGGRIIDCKFSDNDIIQIAGGLAEAKIDIVELGFLRDASLVEYQGNSTFFTDVRQISPFIRRTGQTKYVAFIDFGMYDFEQLGACDGTSIDGIRVGFTKKDLENRRDELVKCMELVKRQGYALYVQGINTLGYSDKEILNLVDLANDISPYSFGIVDTYGAMYMDDLVRLYNLIDHNLRQNICIDIHSHNNFQLSFAFAQEAIKLSMGTRKLILDATLNGMGKCAGNLNTELIVDYLVRKKNYDYEFDSILDIIDAYLYSIKQKNEWGYSIPSFMAGIYKAHPNNVIYLTEKFRLDTKDIKNIISMIDEDTRQVYDYSNIEKIYIEYGESKVDDSTVIQQLREKIQKKEVLVLVPGSSLQEYSEKIKSYIESYNPVIISVNFVPGFGCGYVFWGNTKRYNGCKDFGKYESILASNVKGKNNEDYVVNYYSLINRGYKYFDNTTIMLLNLLKKLMPEKIVIAGFDGFSTDRANNYFSTVLKNDRYRAEYALINNELQSMMESYYKMVQDKYDIEFLTPSIFEAVCGC